MKHRHTWLLALLSILIVFGTANPTLAEEPQAKGYVEIGVSGIDTSDNPARVNEYVHTRSEAGLSFAPKLNLETFDENSSFDLGVDFNGPRDQKIDLGVDAGRILRFNFEHQAMEHWKDHDNLEHLGATFRGDTAGNQPRVTTDLTAGQLGTGETLEEANTRYYQEMDNDYIVTRRESKADADLALPGLPNIVFHAGVRLETREGLEQAITTSKCSQCHVQANGKDIDETTRDLTFGVTGKFGRATLEYEYLNRQFSEDGDDAYYNYLTSGATRAGVADDAQLLYSGTQEYKTTPDSEKDSHLLKARYDISRDSSLSASYVNADVESAKTGEAGTYSLDDDSLTTNFESFFLKGATRIGGLRLSLRGGSYEIEGPEYSVDFDKRDALTTNNTFDNPADYESAESREVTEIGIDGVYRLAKGTTLRLGYEYEKVDRVEEELGETETNTIKASIKSRFNRYLSGRLSYQYQNIDDPFGADNATGIAQGIGDTSDLYPGLAWLYVDDYRTEDGNPASGAVYYWNSVYPARTLSATSEPESIHEAKFSSTWAPTATMAATIFARVRMEENDAVEYQQDTYVPGVTFYYAPNGKMNLTMAYTFNKQKTENRMCVGWYHG